VKHEEVIVLNPKDNNDNSGKEEAGI